MHKMSKAGETFLAGWEGTVLHPYNDATNNATIGIGHLIHLGPLTGADIDRYEHFHGPHGHRKTHPFDLEDAYTYLSDDLASAERALADYVHVPLNQHQVDALLSLVYNCGPAPLAGSLGALLNQRDYTAAANEFLAWDHSDGQVLVGLQRRRAAERDLFLS